MFSYHIKEYLVNASERVQKCYMDLMDEKYNILIEIKAANIAEIEGGSTNLLTRD